MGFPVWDCLVRYSSDGGRIPGVWWNRDAVIPFQGNHLLSLLPFVVRFPDSSRVIFAEGHRMLSLTSCRMVPYRGSDGCIPRQGRRWLFEVSRIEGGSPVIVRESRHPLSGVER